MLKFFYKPIQYNYTTPKKPRKIKYLVIHDTSNENTGADAYRHYLFFNSGNKNASAHYFVDDKQIIQIVGDSKIAWSVGDDQGFGTALNGTTNTNSISIELCVNKDGNYAKAYDNLVELTKNLMIKFNIPVDNVVRHYDVTRKTCPYSMSKDNWKSWHRFKTLITEDRRLIINTDHDSTATEISPVKHKDSPIDTHMEQAIRTIVREEITKALNKGEFTWADKHYDSLIAHGIDIQEKRYNDYITRGSVFKLLDELLDKH